MKIYNFKNAFTLAEIMIVLTIIGILTAILLPTAFHSTPDEDVMKFKKANVTLFNVVNDIASTNKYYIEGDLRTKGDGETAATDNYLCQVMSELLSYKEVDCNDNEGQNLVYVKTFDGAADAACTDGNICDLATAKVKLDEICSNIETPHGITTVDNVIWYEANKDGANAELIDPTCSDVDCNHVYKVFCLRIGAESFGYGIRSDGKILTSENADVFTERRIQDDD